MLNPIRNRYYYLRSRYRFSILFIISLLVCLWLRYPFSLSVQAVEQPQRLPQNLASSVNTPTGSTSTEPLSNQLVQQGVEFYQAGQFTAAIEQWQTALTHYQTTGDLTKTAIVLENLARAYQRLGQTTAEMAHWQQATATYQQLQDRQQVGRMLTEQAQAYSRQGQYRQAIERLCSNELGQPCLSGSAVQIAQELGDRQGEAAALGSLGDTYRLRGNYEAAIEQLQASLKIATDLNDLAYQMSIQNSLGNAYLSLAQGNYRQVMVYEQALSSAQTGVVYPEATALRTEAKDNDQRALLYLQQSLQLAQMADDAEMQVRILLSLIPVYYRSGATSEAEASLEQARSIWQRMVNSQEKVYFALDLAQLMQTPPITEVPVSRWQCANTAMHPTAKTLIEQAVGIAEQLNHSRSQSFALGELGHVYECERNYDRALQFTRQAQLIADQDLGSKDSLYLWQWQAGRIFKSQSNEQADKLSDAIRAYEAAATTLKTIQDDIIVANREVRFDFRDTVEPIYRELVQLRLEQEQPSTLITTPFNSTTNISQALSTLDALKLAELQNYFGNDCVLTALDQGTINLTNINDTKVAVLSTAMLGDRTAVILSFRDETPQLKQKIEWIQNTEGNHTEGHYIDRSTLIDQINQYRQGLENVQDLAVGLRGYNRQYAAQLYDWIIRPFLPILQAQSIETLVFIQDGIFRSIPMAALYDGEKFLIEQYALATTPSLNLTNLNPIVRQRLRALALGVTEQANVDDQVFPQLRFVESELEAIEKTLPNSTALLNQDFTPERVQQELNKASYPIIHIATHGQFRPDAEDTFLVTGYDPARQSQKLTITGLDQIIRNTRSRNPIELLVLSACQTAAGDDRAALGLAGIAAQAGAKSVLASLWTVNDQTTAQLISEFYSGLFQAELSKAKALQVAQRSLIDEGGETAHPYYWAAFILIGNWL